MSAGAAAGALTGEDKLHHQSQRSPEFLALLDSGYNDPLSSPGPSRLNVPAPDSGMSGAGAPRHAGYFMKCKLSVTS
jgi:hypothetical protein